MPEPKDKRCESCRSVPAAVIVDGFLLCGHCAPTEPVLDENTLEEGWL